MEETEEEIMLQIQDTLVSLDLAEVFFAATLKSVRANAASRAMRVRRSRRRNAMKSTV